MSIIGEFSEKVDLVCQRYKCSVTGGRRTEKRNRAKGGVENSLHLCGLAMDLVPDNNTLETRKLVIAYAASLGLYALDETDHVHLSLKKYI